MINRRRRGLGLEINGFVFARLGKINTALRHWQGSFLAACERAARPLRRADRQLHTSYRGLKLATREQREFFSLLVSTPKRMKSAVWLLVWFDEDVCCLCGGCEGVCGKEFWVGEASPPTQRVGNTELALIRRRTHEHVAPGACR